ncbi:hypothetical protein J2847_002262 [Azospirillum agricola]|uniref:DUF4384 domain-containing protein n=1 Tax=Azospirillum agricola TaxID=1720247 RepID=UPI001AE64AFE|nr:DUF4384 domain-containing protein [Azospirillum agricola]MBP2228970.1 hypothetical protein [Azospirillum agricola]
MIRRPAFRLGAAHPASRLCAGAVVALATALTATLSAPAARAAEAVVVASTAPGYKLGQVVADGASVTVPEGAGVMLLFASGRTMRLKGPYAGPFDSLRDSAQDQGAQGGTRPALGGLLGGERFVQTDLGAARSLGSPLNKAAERAFAIDPGIDGTYCIPAGGRPSLTRPQDPALAKISLAANGREGSTTVAWTGDAPAPWPNELALSDGAEFRVSGPDGTPRHTLRFRTLDAASAAPGATNGAALALRLAGAGCARQAAALLAPLRDAVVPLDIYLAADRGPAASYRPGDPFRLVLQANRDAHVYCYLRNTRGQLIPFFPPGSGTSAQLSADTPLTMPGDRMPLPLLAGESAGDMEVRCVAADHDLGGDLPGRADAFRPMSAETVAQLDRALNGMRDTEVVMTQVILRVR